MRLDLSEEKVLAAKDPLEVLFPDPRSRRAARAFVAWLKERGGRATKSAVSRFADELQRGIVVEGRPLRYSRRNFYITVLRHLLQLGFLQRNVPVWDEKRRSTQYVYQRCLFDLPHRPPSMGFWRMAYHLCKKWNDLFLEGGGDKTK